MTFLLILGFLVLLLVLWILFAPINLYVNTWERRAFAELYGIIRFSVILGEDALQYRMRIFFFEFTLKPSDTSNKTKSQVVKKPGKRSFSKKLLRSGIDLLHTFRIKKLIVALDTGDYPTNALLIPLFAVANANPPSQFSINFRGEIGTECHLQNRLSRMLPVIFKMRKLS